LHLNTFKVKKSEVASVFKLHVMRMCGGEEVKLTSIDQFGSSGSTSRLYSGDASFESRLGQRTEYVLVGFLISFKGIPG
jgi:hypothetical protein